MAMINSKAQSLIAMFQQVSEHENNETLIGVISIAVAILGIGAFIASCALGDSSLAFNATLYTGVALSCVTLVLFGRLIFIYSKKNAKKNKLDEIDYRYVLRANPKEANAILTEMFPHQIRTLLQQKGLEHNQNLVNALTSHPHYVISNLMFLDGELVKALLQIEGNPFKDDVKKCLNSISGTGVSKYPGIPAYSKEVMENCPQEEIATFKAGYAKWMKEYGDKIYEGCAKSKYSSMAMYEGIMKCFGELSPSVAAIKLESMHDSNDLKRRMLATGLSPQESAWETKQAINLFKNLFLVANSLDPTDKKEEMQNTLIDIMNQLNFIDWKPSEFPHLDFKHRGNIIRGAKTADLDGLLE